MKEWNVGLKEWTKVLKRKKFCFVIAQNFVNIIINSRIFVAAFLSFFFINSFSGDQFLSNKKF